MLLQSNDKLYLTNKSTISSPIDECAFCLEEKDRKFQSVAVLACGHSYHYSCIQEWIKTTQNPTRLCPQCNNVGEIINIIGPPQNTINTEHKKIYPQIISSRHIIPVSNLPLSINNSNINSNINNQTIDIPPNRRRHNNENNENNNIEPKCPICVIL